MTNQPQPARAAAVHPSLPGSPFRLNLEQQRKRAKELLQALREGDPGALSRFRTYHPRGRNLGDAVMAARLARLSEAQLVIARELGLPSWPRLKAHILAMDQARDRITQGDAAPDRDRMTLHIRCGSDIHSTLREAGLVGDFLEYSDALCQGPVLDEPQWLDRRADFLASAYGLRNGQSRDEIAAKLAAAEERLRSAAARYERVVLWVEHDSYDQLVLTRCLAQFAEATPARLELISVDHYPGSTRFIGLGQLPPDALFLLWNERRPVSATQLQAGQAVWAMLRSPDPAPLALAAATGLPELPHLAKAVRRHCQELPWTRDGLSLTERLILQLLSEQPRTVGQTYHHLMLGREPLPWLGDLMFWVIVENMKNVREPVFTGAFEGEDQRWLKEKLTITALGRAVLAGEADWLSLEPPARWLGGVQIRAGEPCWRWDEQRAAVFLSA